MLDVRAGERTGEDRPDSIGAFLESAAARFADRPALEDSRRRWTAAECREAVMDAAGAVASCTEPGDRVAVRATRDADTLLGLIAVAAAGRVVVPIDPREPAERTESLLAAARPSACLHRGDRQEGIWTPWPADGATGFRPAHLAPGTPALLLFTSGSTGIPKGVLRTHGMLVHQGVEQARSQRLTPGLRVAHAFPLAFLGGVLGLVATLAARAEYCVVDTSVVGPGAFAAELARRRYGGFSAVPSVVRAVAEHALRDGIDLGHVERITFGGEAMTGSDLARARDAMPNARLIAFYGTQEAGSVTSFDATTYAAPEPVPAGTALPQCRVAVVADERPCGPGAVGEVVVAGPYVVTEYWEDAVATATMRTVLDGAPAMRTGDLGRWRDDGVLEIVGRTDHRVKIWGQGVDLLEVEAVLASAPGVGAVVVTALEDARAGHRLVAHVETGHGPHAERPRPDAPSLRRFALERLPAYMVPGTIVLVDALPSTSRDKVDRQAVDAAARALPVAPTDHRARTSEEDAIRTIVAEVLAVAEEQVGVDDDFFVLGGDSLRALELLEAVDERFRLDAERRAALEGAMANAPSVAGLARAVTAPAAASATRASGAGAAILQIGPAKSGPHPPLFFSLGVGHHPIGLRPLAERLRSTTLYTFLPRGAVDRRRPDTDVASWAHRSVELLRSVQPGGPYVLGGFSFGGYVALEAARQLRAAGETVALVVIVDAVLRDPNERHRDPAAWKRTVRTPFARVAERYGELVVAAHPRARVRRDALRYVCGRVVRTFPVTPYPGPVLVLRSAERRDAGADLGWRRVATGRIDVVDVPGRHRAIMRTPNVEVAARAIETAIEAAIERAVEPAPDPT